MFNLSQALELKQGDRGCLVKRSHCLLKLGDTEKALADAEATLAEEKTYHKVCFISFLLFYFPHYICYYYRAGHLSKGRDSLQYG